MTRKAKLDGIESAVNERRLAREAHEGKRKDMVAAKKQFDQAVAQENAAAERADKAERALEKALDDATK